MKSSRRNPILRCLVVLLNYKIVFLLFNFLRSSLYHSLWAETYEDNRQSWQKLKRNCCGGRDEGKVDVVDKLQGCLFSHENGNMSVNQCMKRIFNRMGEVTLTPVFSAIEYVVPITHSLDPLSKQKMTSSLIL